MSRDPWDGVLDGEPLLAGLARLAARRRHARERAEDEDDHVFEEDDEPVRLAAADDDRPWRGGPYEVRVVDGRATQTAGPGGLALRLPTGDVPLVPGMPVELSAPLGDRVDAVDARGRRIRLER